MKACQPWILLFFLSCLPYIMSAVKIPVQFVQIFMVQIMTSNMKHEENTGNEPIFSWVMLHIYNAETRKVPLYNIMYFCKVENHTGSTN